MKENLNMGGKYSIGVFGKKLIGIDIMSDLRRMKMHYIVPLRRNSTLVPDRVKFDSAFMYNGRPI